MYFHQINNAPEEEPGAVRNSLARSAPYWLLGVCLIGLFIFQMTSIALVSVTGMDFIKDAISILVYVPYGWMQTVAFFIFGLSLLSVAVVLQFKAPVKLNLGAILLAIMGFGFFLISACPSNLPGGPVTLVGRVHGLATGMVVMIFPLACFLVAPVLRTWKFRYMHIYTVAAGVFQMLFVALGGYFLMDQQGLTGLFERVMLWNGQIWVIAICLNLLVVEVRHRLPENLWKRLVSQMTVCGALCIYCIVLFPLCLSAIR